MSISKSKQTLKNRYSDKEKQSVTAKNNSTKKNFPNKYIIIGTVSIIICLTLLLILIIHTPSDSESYNVVVTPKNIDELLADNPHKTAPGSYDVCMNSTWTFNNARSASENAYVENLVSNSNTVKFTLTLNDSGEQIYESPYIPVGSSLRNIKLSDNNLKKGTYPCTVTYHLLDDDYEEISTVKISVSIVINNN